MKIKRYAAASMREALSQVRAEQGPDAVILSSRRGEAGIEVIAAVDYDEALFVDATRQRVPEPPISAAPAPPPPQRAERAVPERVVPDRSVPERAAPDRVVPATAPAVTAARLASRSNSPGVVACSGKNATPAAISGLPSEPCM